VLERPVVLKCSTFTDADFPSLSGLPNLEGLDISGTKAISAHGLQKLSAFPRLRQLNVAGCETVASNELNVISQIAALQDLDLSLCHLVTDPDVAGLSKCPHLRRLVLNWCYNITDQSLLALSTHSSLVELSLWSCEKITDLGINSLGALRLTALDLPEFADITNISLKQICHITTLCRLRISNLKNITFEGFAHLEEMHSLQDLVLDHLELSDATLERIGRIQSLRRLEMNSCTGLSAYQITEFLGKHPSVAFIRGISKASRSC
jgi:hypothetical protein